MLHSGGPLHLLNYLPVLPYRYLLHLSNLVVTTCATQQLLLLMFLLGSIMNRIFIILAYFHIIHHLRIRNTRRNLLLLMPLVHGPSSRRCYIYVLFLNHPQELNSLRWRHILHILIQLMHQLWCLSISQLLVIWPRRRQRNHRLAVCKPSSNQLLRRRIKVLLVSGSHARCLHLLVALLDSWMPLMLVERGEVLEGLLTARMLLLV